MNLLPDHQQIQIMASVRGELARAWSVQSLLVEGANITGQALALADAGGWLGVALPEEAGGMGLSAIEDMLIHRELGRALAPLSILATSLAARRATLDSDREAAKKYVRGERRAGFAAPIAQGRALLLDADHVDDVVSLSWDGTLVASTCALSPVACLDPTIQAAAFDHREAMQPPSADLLAHARLLIAAHLCAIGEEARDAGIAYAGVREQFGKPIGAFQAIKHRCADAASRCELAQAQLFAAASALAEGNPRAHAHAAAAYLNADDAAINNVRDAVQIHGAIGVTNENALHLFLKRRHVLAHLGGADGIAEILLAA